MRNVWWDVRHDIRVQVHNSTYKFFEREILIIISRNISKVIGPFSCCRHHHTLSDLGNTFHENGITRVRVRR